MVTRNPWTICHQRLFIPRQREYVDLRHNRRIGRPCKVCGSGEHRNQGYQNRYIFAGDQVGFTAEVFGVTAYRKGTVVRGDTGMWQVMVDETIPFGLHNVNDRVILGHIYEGV